MIRKTDLSEAVDLLDDVLARLLQAGAGADLRRLCGALQADARQAIAAGAVGARLLACFDAAQAGATLQSIGLVISRIMGLSPAGWPAKAVQQACLRMALMVEARVIAGAVLASRAQADALLARINDDFEVAEDFAAGHRDAAVYRALTALHAAVTRDLVTRSAPLPNMVSYTFAKPMPALWIANRLYGDGARVGEIVDQNRAPHPLFMAATGRALSK